MKATPLRVQITVFGMSKVIALVLSLLSPYGKFDVLRILKVVGAYYDLTVSA